MVSLESRLGPHDAVGWYSVPPKGSSSGARSTCPDSGAPGGRGGRWEASQDSFVRLTAWTVSEKNILLVLAAVSWNQCECDS